MKICPTCGTTAGDSASLCELDGTVLVAGASANTLPVRRASGAWCAKCGSRDGQDGAGYCVRCGARFARERSLIPGVPGSLVGEFTVVRPHGDGDLCVTDSTGATRLLVFGSKERIAAEASALGGDFPAVLAEGHTLEVGHFLVLPYDVAGATPLLRAKPSLTGGFELVERVLTIATALEARGFAWEPAPTDLYVKEGGEVVVVRVRGARKLTQGERLDAKRAMEALAVALLPEPFSHTTPAVIRLLLPRWNFTTPETRTLAEVRDDMGVAAQLVAESSKSTVAELSDPGLRRPHHEDATAVADGHVSGEPFSVLVVCDGVSSSTHADEASAIAARVARDRLAAFLKAQGESYGDARPDLSLAVADAIGDAHLAICNGDIAYGRGAPPGTTIVVAVVVGRTLTVGWVGDSRAYWIAPNGSDLCTTDHSWLNDAIARGSLTETEALASPFAHALTRCLGPLEGGSSDGSRPDVRTRAIQGPGCVVVCTDGLWNYFPTAEMIESLVDRAGPGADARSVARFLVCRALAEGGGDNVSVAVCQVRA